MRHGIITDYDPGRGVAISTLAHEYVRGHQVAEHAHGADQLVYAIRGVMRVSAGRSVWLIPPLFAIWIPARVRHAIDMPGPVSMRTIYLRRGLARRAPASCAVLHVSPLLRELILEAVRIGGLRRSVPLHDSICDLLIAQLQRASALPICVTMPTDLRVRRVAAVIVDNPAERSSLAELCDSAGVGLRTLQRVFRREVGSDFECWRRHVRLVKAVELLVEGHSVKETSHALGYQRPTAFIEMFRGVLGTTPGAWSAALRARAFDG